MAEENSLDRLTEDQQRVLVAVIEGYRAREGMKDRIRALNEWEIARRSGSTSLSYAEYMRDPGRDGLMTVLAHLQRLGLIAAREGGGSYDTFVPTERGSRTFDAPNGDNAMMSTAEIGPPQPASSDPVVERLDQIISILRSIDARLSR